MSGHARPALDLTEKQWQMQVVDLARMLGWERLYHTFNSRRSASGFPDLFMVRDRALLLELKTETGKLSGPQADWIRALDRAGVEVYVARPRHLDLLAKLLACRGNPYDRRGEPRDAAVQLRAETVSLAGTPRPP